MKTGFNTTVSKVADFYNEITSLYNQVPKHKRSEKTLFDYIISRGEKINELSKKCRQSNIYKLSNISIYAEQTENFYLEMKKSAKTKPELTCALFFHLAERMSNAPTQMLLIGTCLLFFPLLDKAIKEDF